MASYRKRNGKWQFRVTYKDDQGQRKEIPRGGFRTKAEAQNAAHDLIEKMKHGNTNQNPDITFGAYFDKWRKLYRSQDKDTTTLSHYDSAARIIKEYFIGKPLRYVTKDTYQAFLNKYSEQYAKVTMQKFAGYIRSSVRDAIEEQLITRDFTRGTIVSGKASKQQADKYLQSFSDFQKLSSYVSKRASYDSIQDYAILIASYTGARIGEIRGLTWDKIDFEKNKIEIARTWRKDNTGFGKLKNIQSHRTISVNPELISLLASLHKEQQNYYDQSGFSDKFNLVLRARNGQVVSDETCNKALKKYLTELNITPLITMHGLRHTHASTLLFKDVSVYTVSERLGHDSVQTTIDIYLHVMNELKRREDTKSVESLADLIHP